MNNRKQIKICVMHNQQQHNKNKMCTNAQTLSYAPKMASKEYLNKKWENTTVQYSKFIHAAIKMQRIYIKFKTATTNIELMAHIKCAISNAHANATHFWFYFTNKFMFADKISHCLRP